MSKEFFRIRMNFIKEKKYKKYFVFAIGEMLLIIIGIIVALQIDNWREYQKERKSERQVLSEIRDNLKYDLMDFEDNITHLQNINTSSKSLLRVINDDTPYNVSFGYFFSYLSGFPHFSCKTNGYSLLQSKGLEIILNDTLRKYITDLYEDYYQYILTLEKERINYNITLLEDAMKPYMGINSMPIDDLPKSIIIKGGVKPLVDFGVFRNIRNYDHLKKDEDIQSMIKNVEIWTSAILVLHSYVENEIKDLILLIEQELEE